MGGEAGGDGAADRVVEDPRWTWSVAGVSGEGGSSGGGEGTGQKGRGTTVLPRCPSNADEGAVGGLEGNRGGGGGSEEKIREGGRWALPEEVSMRRIGGGGGALRIDTS